MTHSISRAHNEFRSDTFTTPTPAMLKAMTEASHGDAVYQEDDCTAELEKKVAKLAGKEAGLFCVSGTLSNQLGIRVNLSQPPYSILCDDRSHVYRNEAAGLAILSQAIVYPVMAKNGVHITLDEVKDRVVLGTDQHIAPTKLISLENTMSGSVMPIDEIRKISEFARAHGIRMHLDGARLWNASAATDIPLDEYCKHFDTVSLCLSKGIGAPIGSVLVGDKDVIQRAFHLRKQQGGGIRQSGPLCAAAIVAIDEVWPTMKLTHLKAKALAKNLEAVGVKLALPVDTSFIVCNLAASGIDADVVAEEGKKLGVTLWGSRICLHHQVSDESIGKVLEAFIRAKKVGIVAKEENLETDYSKQLK